MPLIATDIVDAAGQFRSGVSIVNSITGGFGSTLGSIGIIIGFGVMMGQIFEVSGAAASDCADSDQYHCLRAEGSRQLLEHHILSRSADRCRGHRIDGCYTYAGPSIQPRSHAA